MMKKCIIFIVIIGCAFLYLIVNESGRINNAATIRILQKRVALLKEEMVSKEIYLKHKHYYNREPKE